MKTISIFGLVVSVSIALLQPAQGRSHGGGGGARSFAPGYHFSGSAGRYSGYSRGYPGGGAGYYRSAPRYYQGAIGNRAYSSATAQRAVNRGVPRAVNRTASGIYSPSRTQVSTARQATLRAQGINSQGRISPRVSSGWNRHQDHFWHGHRCHWYNNAWVIIDPWFYWGYPWSYGYYGYGYGYPYDPYYYGGGSYYDDQYAPAGYSDYGNGYSNDGNGESTVSLVQSALARRGYYHGAVDGRMGPATRSALRQYQLNHNLEVTGEIDQGVVDALRAR